MDKPTKDILLITNYYHFEEEKGSSRYRTLAEMIAKEENISLELVTSSFYHQTKEQRSQEMRTDMLPFKVTLCYEDGYSKNISFQRLKSCRTFAKSVLAYLEQRKKPDLIYQVVPSLDVADAVTAYAEKNDIPLIVDIQDLWPEAFRMAMDIPLLSDIAFLPMKRKADRVYGRADQIVAVSETYVARAMDANKKCNRGLSVYIGTDEAYAASAMKDWSVEKPENEFWVTYVGALGHSYDIDLIAEAISILKGKGIGNIVFQVFGDGVSRKQFEATAQKLQIDARFHGFVEYGKMMAMLTASDVAVNPIVGKSVSSIINKVADYAVAGIPVVNTQNSEEYRNLLEEYQCGINCESGNAHSVAEAIERLYYDILLKEYMRAKAKKLGKERFNRQDTYGAVVNLIQKMLKE